MERSPFKTRPPFKQIVSSEREIIRRMMVQKKTVPEIAKLLGKHRTSIWREVKRNTNAAGIYYEIHAQGLLRRRRIQSRENFRLLENDPMLEAYVERMLKFGLSPEQIDGFMHKSSYRRPISYRTVYRWVHRRWQSRKSFLRFSGKPRAAYGSKKDSWDPNKRHISSRPQIVEKRERVGDWEADLVHGTQDDSRHSILSLVDRATGFCILRKLTALDSITVSRNMVAALQDLPVKTITCDNGFEFGRHKRLEASLRCRVYFTDVNSPEQRGSNENLNGLLRQFFPKGQSLAHVTELQVADVAARRNGRPRKRFNFDSPRYLFAAKAGKSPYFSR